MIFACGDEKKMVDDKKIEEIIGRGNTAEVKKTKKGVIILEVSRKIRYENKEENPAHDEGEHTQDET
jgi:hypothetical protein